ncbi:MAG: C13 family peptidase [Candidatus Eisenbacteria bacterium]|nr:C13 family peptidase [Candidatus Eisenbacteria bacterium]
MFTTLINKYGFTKKNIFVLSSSGTDWDLDGDGVDDIDYAATRANIFAVFDTLDYNKDVDENDLVLVYVTDHGHRDKDKNKSYMNLFNYLNTGEQFSDTEMDSVFTNLEDEDVVDYWPHLLGVFEQCDAGGFVDSIIPYCKRAVCSACKADETSMNYAGIRGRASDAAYRSTNYSSFAYWWIVAMNGAHPEGDAADADSNDDGYVSFKEAFEFAKANDEYAVSHTETPQYFDFEEGYGKTITLSGVQVSMGRAGLNRADPNRPLTGGGARLG